MLNYKINLENWKIRQYHRAIRRLTADLDRSAFASISSGAVAEEKLAHWRAQIGVHSTLRDLYQEKKAELLSRHKELFFLKRLHDELDQRLYFLWFICIPYRLETAPASQDNRFQAFHNRLIAFSQTRLDRGVTWFLGRIGGKNTRH